MWEWTQRRPQSRTSILLRGAIIGALGGLLFATLMLYGMTRDGSVPDPAQDNGRTGRLAAQRGQLWWGLTRGTDLSALAGEKEPFPIASQVVALSLQNLPPTTSNPSLAGTRAVTAGKSNNVRLRLGWRA